MSTNDIFYVAIVLTGIMGMGSQIIALYAIHRYTSKPETPHQDQ